MIVRKTSRILAALLLAAGASPLAAQAPRACMGVVIGPSDGPGVTITDVSANSPADLAWLRAGDVIQGVIIGGKNDRPVRTVPDLTNLMSQLSVGDTVLVRFQRGSKERMTQVTLTSEPMRNQQRSN
jgi:S1-C subfamily serine protease